MPDDSPISLDQARLAILDGAGPLGNEVVTLGEALGRTLARPVVARHDQPPAPVSAMDGYAARAADIAVGARLKVVGEAPAGAPFDGAVGPGDCIKIATGGVVPAGADRIVILERVTAADGVVTIEDASGPAFVRPSGLDFRAGQQLVAAGRRIGPAAIGLLAAAGVDRVAVGRRPRVAILAAGDELSEPGQPLVPGATYNSAAFALAALVEEWGGTAVRLPVLGDDLDCIATAIRDLEQAVDLFVPVGGASVGERDLFRPAFEAIGARLHFWRINVVPGKPCWHARLDDGRAVVGLPGNPASAYVCAHLLLRPLIDALLGDDSQSSTTLRSASLAAALPANGPREAWLRAMVTFGPDATASVTVDDRQDSSLQTPLLSANALVQRAPSAAPCAAGSVVQFLPLAG